MNLLNTKIQTIEGVSRTETFISLDQQIDRDRFTLATATVQE
jgi:Lrp/AsnC family transcriptional regulator for asnA, asnC and gidA